MKYPGFFHSGVGVESETEVAVLLVAVVLDRVVVVPLKL